MLGQAVKATLWRAWRWALLDEGSTRPTALMRIGLGTMLWLKLADRFLVYSDSTVVEVVLAVSFHLATLGTVLGAFSRLSTAVVAVLGFAGYAGLGPFQEAVGWVSHNTHLLVSSSMLLALCPSGRSLSLDRWWALRRAERGGLPALPEVAPLWSVRLLGLLVASVYLSTVLNKTSELWLSGHHLQGVLALHYTGSALYNHRAYEGLVIVAALGVWLVELVLVFGLFVPRLRAPVAVAGVLLHGSFSMLFRVFTFSANMILLYLPLFPPAQVDALIDRLCPPGLTADSASVATPSPRLALRALLVVATLLGLLVAGPRLLEGVEASFLRPATLDQKERDRVEREEMQKWSG